ncbi:ribonuclease H-like domain-containing protein [Tanacetum coccineum]
MFLFQKTYASEVLERVGMRNCHSCMTPIDTESNLRDNGTLVSDPTFYRSLDGALKYLTFTRPDLSYVVQQVCLYMHDPREPHFAALKRILRYVCDTLAYGLQLSSSASSWLPIQMLIGRVAQLLVILLQLQPPLHFVTIVYRDNVSAVYLSSNPMQQLRLIFTLFEIMTSLSVLRPPASTAGSC